MHEKNKTKQILKNARLVAIIPIAAGFVLFVSFAQTPSITTLPNSSTMDSETKEKIEELEKRAKVYREIISIKQKQGQTLSNQISLMDSNIAQIESQIEINKRKIDDLNNQIIRLQKQIEENKKIITYQKEMLSDMVQAYYEYSQQNVLSTFFQRNSISAFMVQKDRLSQTGDKISALLQSVTDLKTKMEKEVSDLEEKKKQIIELRYDLEDKTVDLTSTKTNKESLLIQTKGEESRYQNLLEKVKEQQKEIQREIERIELGKSGVDLGPIPPSKSGFFAYPINPVNITQGYGKTSFSNNYASGKHNGIDFGIDYKSVYAAGNGKVLQTGDNGKYAYGKWIVIDHENGLLTLYGHLSKIYVSKGESLKTGEKIGISGDTGFSTGPHLHLTVFAKKTFELTESRVVPKLMLPTGTSLNPMNYL